MAWQKREKAPFCDRKELIRRSLGIFLRKMRDDFLWDIFLAKKRGVTVIEQWPLPRPKGNHYSHTEIVHIISIAPLGHLATVANRSPRGVPAFGRCPRSRRACAARASA